MCIRDRACAVALRVLEIVSRQETLDGVRAKAARLSRGLSELGERFGVFESVRGMGLLLGCVLTSAYAGRARDVLKAAEEEGLMLLVAGTNVVRLAPSLLVSDADIDEGLARLERALTRLTR